MFLHLGDGSSIPRFRSRVPTHPFLQLFIHSELTKIAPQLLGIKKTNLHCDWLLAVDEDNHKGLLPPKGHSLPENHFLGNQ